jgi:ribosome-associated protein
MIKKTNISTEYIKLDSFLKLCGAVLSGGQAKELVRAGKIKVNGEVCLQRGRKLKVNDAVIVEDDQYQYVVGSDN